MQVFSLSPPSFLPLSLSLMALLPLVPLTIQSHIPLAACSLQAQHHPGWQQRQSTALVLLANAAKELMKWIECNDTHGPRWVGASLFFSTESSYPSHPHHGTGFGEHAPGPWTRWGDMHWMLTEWGMLPGSPQCTGLSLYWSKEYECPGKYWSFWLLP